MWTSRAIALFFSLLLLSESTAATVRNYGLKIAQMSATTQQDATRAEAQKALDEGMAFYQEGTAESLKQAIKKWEESLVLWRKVDDAVSVARTLNNIGSVYDLLGDRQKALDYYNQALPLLQLIADKQGEAATLNNIGKIHYHLGNKQKALDNYNQALRLERLINHKVLEATTLGNIGVAYSDLGDKQKALDNYNQALLLTRLVENKAGEARILTSIGLVYSDLGDKQKALDNYNQALSLWQLVEYKAGKATTLNNIGLVYSDLGDRQKALDYYYQALPLLRLVGDRGGEAATLNNVGLAYDLSGDKQKALDYYNQALSLTQLVGDKVVEARMFNNIGKVYNALGDKQKALDNYKKALSLTRLVEDKLGEGVTLGNMGQVYFDLGEKQKALNSYKQALSIKRLVGNKAGEAATLSDIGQVYSDLGDKQKALNNYNQALSLTQLVGDKAGEATTLANVALLEGNQGNLQVSLKQIERAIAIVEGLRKTYTNKDLQSTYFSKVQGYYKFYINLLMQLHKKDSSKICEFTTKDPNSNQDITIKDKCNALALHISERSRARGLLELLTEANAKIRKGANPELLSEERRVQALIDGKEKVRFDIVNSDKINTPGFRANAENLQKEIDELLSQQKQLEIKIRSSNPKYASLKYPQPLTLPQIQQQLDKDTLLLQYSLGEERSYVWVVSPNSVNTYELTKKQQIEKTAINLFCLISQNSSKPPSVANKENPCTDIKTQRIDVATKELSQLILTPVKDKLGKKRLVIVADGALQYIPFAALADLKHSQSTAVQQKGEKEKQKDTNCVGGGISTCPNHDSQKNKFDYQPLFVNHEIVNLPSASTIAIQRKELATRSSAPKASKALAILADPVYSATDERVTNAQSKQLVQQESRGLELERSALKRSADITNRQGWGRLLGTRSEAQTIVKLVPDSKSLQVFDFDANYDWAASNALNQFRILHFATHGFVNDANPELSGIVLSLVDKQGQDIRGYLRLGDLFNLNYPADLIVLSACETGLGKEIQGEGLVGLTRGLMYAGGERLVVSLWQVDDEGTSVFMQEFYQQMWQAGLPASAALRATQLKMWRSDKWRNPNYWAAFTFLGEWHD